VGGAFLKYAGTYADVKWAFPSAEKLARTATRISGGSPPPFSPSSEYDEDFQQVLNIAKQVVRKNDSRQFDEAWKSLSILIDASDLYAMSHS